MIPICTYSLQITLVVSCTLKSIENQNSKYIMSSQEGGINIIQVNPVTASLE